MKSSSNARIMIYGFFMLVVRGTKNIKLVKQASLHVFLGDMIIHFGFASA
jgi:hypothetical protein